MEYRRGISQFVWRHVLLFGRDCERHRQKLRRIVLKAWNCPAETNRRKKNKKKSGHHRRERDRENSTTRRRSRRKLRVKLRKEPHQGRGAQRSRVQSSEAKAPFRRNTDIADRRGDSDRWIWTTIRRSGRTDRRAIRSSMRWCGIRFKNNICIIGNAGITFCSEGVPI